VKIVDLLAEKQTPGQPFPGEIYVDMDGVLADFFGSWAELMKVDKWWNINKEHDIDDALQKIRDTDDFWLNIPLTSNAKTLLNLIKQVKGSYNICSSPLPGDPNSEPHKREWIEKHLAFFPPKNIYITHDKVQYAVQADGTPNILIDDYGVNINKWEAAGGIGFKHKDHKFERTAKRLMQGESLEEVAPYAAAVLIMRIATLAEKIFKGEKFLRVSQPLQREAKYLQNVKNKYAGGKDLTLNRQQSKEIGEKVNDIRISTNKIDKLEAERRVGERISEKELNAAYAKRNAAQQRVKEIVEQAAKIENVK